MGKRLYMLRRWLERWCPHRLWCLNRRRRRRVCRRRRLLNSATNRWWRLDTVTCANSDATSVKRKTSANESVEVTGTMLANALAPKNGWVKVTWPLMSDITREMPRR